MNVILNYFNKYGITYNPKTKIIKIKKPILVSQYILLKELIEYYDLKINNIIIGE